MPGSVTRRGAADAFSVRGASASPPPSLVAVVDDDLDSREALADFLASSGYRVLEFDGAEAALRAMDGGVRPDIILLDLNMPGMNGWEFRVEQLRRPALADVPLVALSGDSSAYAAAMDADAHLGKPIDGNRVCLVIEQVLVANDRRRLAAQAAELERVRALGMLVAGVAHEINNPLTYAKGNLEVALARCARLQTGVNGSADSLQSLTLDLQAAADGTERIAHVVRLLSSFGRNPKEGAGADVMRAIDAASRLAMHEIRPRARLACRGTPVPKVRAGEGELAQVILNLLTNAAHAVPEGSPDAHEITIRTSVEDDQVVIEVTDDGSGIAPELQARVFEPFFSTKPVGKGMGLGLSISRDMVSAFGGSISLRSDLGKGTTFRVTLPSAAPSAAETGSDGASGPAPSTLCRRVLVIDDEAMIANLVRQMLSDCQVETVTDPRAGVVRAVEGLHDVVLCDLHMPEMGGMAVYGAIRRQRPHGGPAFVLMTGAAIDDDVEAFLATENVSVLLKPFTIIDLKDRVHHASGSVK